LLLGLQEKVDLEEVKMQLFVRAQQQHVLDIEENATVQQLKVSDDDDDMQDDGDELWEETCERGKGVVKRS
jgi:hypothetical protein